MSLCQLKLLHERFVFFFSIFVAANFFHALGSEVFEFFWLHTLALSVRRDAFQSIKSILELFELEAA
jgi:hypothetical protein